VMTRNVLPSWPATIAAGLLSGLAIATRTGGIITHAYLLGALLLCAAEVFAKEGRLAPRYLLDLARVLAPPSSSPGSSPLRCGHGSRSAIRSRSSRPRSSIS
jgi:hypothetical protein